MDDISSMIADWPVDRAAVGVTTATDALAGGGDPDWVTGIASVSKLLTGYAGLIAIEEGTIDIDEPAGPKGSTVRHLLAHASGLAFSEHRPLAEPGRRRIYSNVGIELLADHLEVRAGMRFEQYLHLGVFEPLAMTSSTLMGSPAHAVYSNVSDLLAFGRELLAPTLVSAGTVRLATRPHFPRLPGVLPGIGRFDPNPWGLAFEIRGEKEPHWTGTANTTGTFGHFGGSGTFLWVDPAVGLACVALSDREFGSWSLEVWPSFSDAVLARFGDVTAEDRTTP